MKTVSYYLLTSFVAILLGLGLANVIRPGDGLEIPGGDFDASQLEKPGSLGEIIIRMIPENVVRAAWDMDVLGLIFFGIVWGIVGMFLATPIVAVVRLLLERFEYTKPVADVMAGRLDRLDGAPAASAGDDSPDPG